MDDMKEVTLFLIEDDDIDAMAVERSLKKQKIANPVKRAYDGVQALEMLKDGVVSKPFTILLDIQMPRMNGLEFLTALRANETFADSVVFVLTTSKAEQDIIHSYQHHVAGYFVKNEAGANFRDCINMLDSYWKIVHAPI
ncbi:response regulator [Thalassomonas actiniarum]|uniref:Response regulator n=1 Tax=Thalassomonas actiniarum TaxID=485447 RepID=A0AAE9YK20_9GAMM|nr:response regulator [Thalassomonas actiniarum]WDD97065.1 response regulator [Thalassomonas actiniarum]